MTKAQIIDKYIQRIMVDYPEADKIHITLVQFAEELRQCDANVSVVVEEILQPKFMNEVYTSKEIQDAIKQATGRFKNEKYEN